MKVTVKASGGTQKDLELEPALTIADVKNKLVDLFEMPASNQRLIFRGRIVKDSDTLEALKVTDGSAMHLVKSAVSATPAAPSSGAAPAAAPAATAPAAAAPAAPQAAAANPFAGIDPAMLSGLGGMGGMGGMPGMPGMPPMDPQMIAQMMQNPFMQQMMQNFMQNPELLRQMVSNNPLLQNMADSNPAVRDALSNPQLLQSVMNPAMFGGAAPTGGAGAGAGAGAGGAAGMPDLSALLGGAGGGNPDMFANMNRMMQDPATQARVQQMMQGMPGLEGLLGGAGAMPQAPPPGTNLGELYAAQLKQLEEMGFPDREANLNALTSSGGDVNRAITVLLERGFGN